MQSIYRTCPTRDGSEIQYIDMGEGTPVLFIHGFGSNAESQLPYFEFLKSRYRCLTWNQRGFGGTSAERTVGLDQSARDMKDLMEYLGLNDVVPIGYSLGGVVLFSYIRLFGTECLGKIILGDTTPKFINDEEWKMGLYQGWYTKEAFLRDIQVMKTDYDAWMLYFAVQTLLPHTPSERRDFNYKPELLDVLKKAIGDTPALYDMLRVPEEQKKSNVRYWEQMDYDFREILPGIDVPAALMFASPGSVFDPRLAEYLAGKIPDTKTFLYENSTHMFRVTKAKQFLGDIVSFVG
ncbi:alpha/beta fold hydrolase [Papillibacter cinnamivorans]|uniref:Pimeloyl-ACP methyl ester carboxylesterase n=1 Tax=Papillibacter cinnamivorans DSM 12816 TaxID=1122930 RepID=A0A1W1YJR0_9FIRM|nr:alpha/beta hydrolase [Papillibacter cinnamivorans]SMC36372.1 Pimeloyl-ACP methyl ester carboxylesterase [Papillibacter cinnamivorans DSM 12816]